MSHATSVPEMTCLLELLGPRAAGRLLERAKPVMAACLQKLVGWEGSEAEGTLGYTEADRGWGGGAVWGGGVAGEVREGGRGGGMAGGRASGGRGCWDHMTNITWRHPLQRVCLCTSALCLHISPIYFREILQPLSNPEGF